MPSLKRPPRDGLVRALPRLSLRAAEDPEEPGEMEDPGETPAQEAQEEAAERGMPTLEGHFLLFNQWTEINSYYEGQFLESIAPGAVRKTLADGADTIRCLFQHGMDFLIGDKPLGSQTSEEDAKGARYTVPLFDTAYNRELIPGLEAGVYGASFCFSVVREDFNEEPEASELNPKGMPERVLREIRVMEFGPVTFPAYDDATAELSSKGCRSMTDSLLAEQLKRDPAAVEDILARAARPDDLARMLERRGVRAIGRLPKRSQTPAAAPPARTVTIRVEPDTSALDEAIEQFAERASALREKVERAFPDTEATKTDEPTGAPRNADGEQPEATAPPEGADPQDHPRSGRRDPENTDQAQERAEKGPTMNLSELRARQETIRSRIVEIGEQHAESELPTEIQTEYDGLLSERSENDTKIESIEARHAEIRRLAESAPSRETPTPVATETGDGPAGGAQHRATPERERPYDLEATMSRALGASSTEARGAIMRDAALRAIDQESRFPARGVNVDAAKVHIEGLLRREAELQGTFRSEIAERIIGTGSEEYQRSFVKAIAGKPLTSEEQRALATFTGNVGGFAVPYTLDPTVIPTSNYSVNPYRAIARVETILGNEWKGVTSGAVTVAYAAEAAEATDNTPTLAQPTANPERCQAWIPYSMELEGDWPAALAEMATLIAEGKDDVEATKFTSGAGHASNEPEGLLTGASEISKTATEGVFVLADFYAWEESLPPRFRPRAEIVGNRVFFNKIRQFDTAGGAGLWVTIAQGIGNNVPTPGQINPRLAGLPTHECSALDNTIATKKKVAVVGDFRHLLIVDRVGMNIEVVQHVVGASQRPTGQRGLYAFWRNTSKVLAKQAFRVLEVK